MWRGIDYNTVRISLQNRGEREIIWMIKRVGDCENTLCKNVKGAVKEMLLGKEAKKKFLFVLYRE